LADGLRADGMTVSTFPSVEPALEELSRGERPAVLIVEPQQGPLTDLEFTEQAKALSPCASIIFTPQLADARARPGAPILAHPLDSARLARFIRLVGGRPAFRSTLQSLYREARNRPETTTNPCEPVAQVRL
jgi:hypothetical protein